MASRAVRLPETSLYATVKEFLEGLGYRPKGEVCGCDIVAVCDGEPSMLVIAELKVGFSLELLLQGVDRMRAADEVWMAVRATRRGRDQDRRVHRLCRMLGLGLLAVDPARRRVDVLAEPAPYRPRPDLKRRKRLLREHALRQGDPNTGGGTRQPIMTAYRQQALACAVALQEKSLRPRDLRAMAPDAGSILRRNVYGWFERVQPGWYRLAQAGVEAVALWSAAP